MKPSGNTLMYSVPNCGERGSHWSSLNPWTPLVLFGASNEVQQTWHWSKHGALMTQSDTVIWIDVWKTSACRSLHNGDKEDQQIISSANRNNKTEPPVLQESSVSWICKVLNPAKKKDWLLTFSLKQAPQTWLKEPMEKCESKKSGGEQSHFLQFRANL